MLLIFICRIEEQERERREFKVMDGFTKNEIVIAVKKRIWSVRIDVISFFENGILRILQIIIKFIDCKCMEFRNYLFTCLYTFKFMLPILNGMIFKHKRRNKYKVNVN